MRAGFIAVLLVMVTGMIGAMVYFSPGAEVRDPGNVGKTSSMIKLSSSAFEDGGVIPSEYTCDGRRNVNPPLAITGVPEEAKSLVLVMDDPDIPQEVKDSMGISVFDHWVLYNINPETTEIPSGAPVGDAGLNTSGEAEYTGPCPPPQYEPKEHRYVFTLYALSGTLNFVKAPTKEEVLQAIDGMTLDSATLTGRYARQ